MSTTASVTTTPTTPTAFINSGLRLLRWCCNGVIPFVGSAVGCEVGKIGIVPVFGLCVAVAVGTRVACFVSMPPATGPAI